MDFNEIQRHRTSFLRVLLMVTKYFFGPAAGSLASSLQQILQTLGLCGISTFLKIYFLYSFFRRNSCLSHALRQVKNSTYLYDRINSFFGVFLGRSSWYARKLAAGAEKRLQTLYHATAFLKFRYFLTILKLAR